MRRCWLVLIGAACATAIVQEAAAITVDELGTAPAETVAINCTGVGTVIVDAGVLQLNVDGTVMDAICIDPFHFSNGSMTGYQVVGLTSAPKGNPMSAVVAMDIERLWGSYYSSGMSAQAAAGLQIAIWELVGGSGFRLVSNNDYGAAGLLSAIESPDYSGPAADLSALTGPGQDYAIQSVNLNSLSDPVPDSGSTLGLFTMAVCGVFLLSWKMPGWTACPAQARAWHAGAPAFSRLCALPAATRSERWPALGQVKPGARFNPR